MKALGILAGPRKGKTTDKLITAVLDGFLNGGEVDKVDLYDYDIKPCRGCCCCEEGKDCPIEDDQKKILDLMEEADVVVFGSPVYWSNVTSEAKKFFDRAANFFERGAMGPVRRKDRPSVVVLVNSCGAPWPFSSILRVTSGSFNAMKAFFSRTGARIYKLSVTGMMDPHKSEPSKRSLKKAYALGERVAARGRG
jgi:multimeric flavodoxin WrbA